VTVYLWISPFWALRSLPSLFCLGDPLVDQDSYLIWLAGVPWDGIPGTDRHLATALARHTPIMWVDPPISPISSARSGHKTWQSLRPLLEVIEDRFVRLTPIALPGFTRRGVRSTTPMLTRAQVRWAVRRLGIRPFAVVATYLSGVLGYLGGDLVNVLYGTDDYVAGAELMGLSTAHQRRRERTELAHADLVVAVSPNLASRWARLGAKPVVIPNGCWQASSAAASCPVDIPALPRPVVGLVGQLSERIDLGALEAVAEAGLSLLIVGPVDSRWETDRFAKLTGHPQVHYAGAVPAETVPSYLASIDIGITPYRDSAFNRASFPLKTLEYLAAGRPVVSADLPAARWLRADVASSEHSAVADRIIVIARTGLEFPTAIRRLMALEQQTATCAPSEAGSSRTTAQWCAAFAARHTWQRRAEQFAAVIGLPLRPDDRRTE
jgi:teichuronic acid biosynthesis glycosyltransferase TuaH